MPKQHPFAPTAGAPAVSPLLSAVQLSEILGLSVPELERARTLYGLPYIELGPKKLRYRLEDALAWLERRRTTVSAQTEENEPVNDQVLAHVAAIACNDNVNDEQLSHAIQSTDNPRDRRILSFLAGIKAAMMEGVCYDRHSALTNGPEPFPVDPAAIVHTNPQASLGGNIREAHRRVASLLDEMHRIDCELTVPSWERAACCAASTFTGWMQDIAISIATIKQLRDLINSKAAGDDK